MDADRYMKRYDFDTVIDRRGSASLKVDGLKKRYGRDDLMAMWVADMDFATPDFIIDALRKRLDHPILGYSLTGDDYFDIISAWVEDLHGWKVDSSFFRYIPGIVKGIGFAERCFLSEGDKVIIQPPVYHPFRLVSQACGFEVVNNPLIPEYDSQGFLKTYHMDLDGLKRLIDNRTKMLILSNPHNPCGVCFPKEELQALAEICSRHGIIVISDEIHSEMVFSPRVHTPFASVSEQAAECSITFMAPSKTFNIAGVVSSYCIILNPELREKFFSYLEANEIDDPSLFSVIATRAAYTPEGRMWRDEMLTYVNLNARFTYDWCKKHLPQIHPVLPEASFLVWLDCRALGLEQKQLVDLFIDKAHLALNDGEMFGEQGKGYMRLNIGCPRSVLAQALEQLKAAVESLG